MLNPVTVSPVMLALREQLRADHGLSKDSPELLHQAIYVFEDHVRRAFAVITGLGFVIAQEGEDGPAESLQGTATQVAEVMTIFATGKRHAPDRMAALRDAWPSLAEALDALVETDGEVK